MSELLRLGKFSQGGKKRRRKTRIKKTKRRYTRANKIKRRYTRTNKIKRRGTRAKKNQTPRRR